MNYGLTVAVEPVEEPVTLAEAQLHMRAEETEDDGYITSLISAARRRAEDTMQRAIITQTLTMTLDGFPIGFDGGSYETPAINLPRSPVQSVSAIRYIDDAGAQQTLATSRYRVDVTRLVARITPAYADYWPTTRPITSAVEVDFIAGYGLRASVPPEIRQAIMIMAGTWYESREDVAYGTFVSSVPRSAAFLLSGHRVARVAGS